MRFAVALLAFAAAALAQSSPSDAASGSSAVSSPSAAASSAGKSAAPSKSSSNTAAAPSGSASATGLSDCANNCVFAAAAASDCKLVTNVTCVCTDPNFQAMATSCLTSECSPSEVQTAVGVQNQTCSTAHLSVSGSASGSATAPFHPVNSAADISGAPSGSSSANASSASASGSAPAGGALALGSGSFGVACAVALVGTLLGALAVL